MRLYVLCSTCVFDSDAGGLRLRVCESGRRPLSRQLLRRQYSYLCTSKASKVSSKNLGCRGSDQYWHCRAAEAGDQAQL